MKIRPFFRQSLGKIFKHQISWKSVLWEPICATRTDRRTLRS